MRRFRRWWRRRCAKHREKLVQEAFCRYYDAQQKSFLSGAPPAFSLDLPFPEEILEQFCNGRHLDGDGDFCRDFLGPMNLFKGFEEEDHAIMAQETVDKMNSHRTAMLLQAGNEVQKLSKHFKNCPVVWDTGASHEIGRASCRERV